MEGKIKILNLLKTDLIKFLDNLIETFPEESDFIVLRFLVDKYPIENVMKYIVDKLLPLSDLVNSKNERFFLENNILFEEFSEQKDKINYFKNMWENGSLDEEEKDCIWSWFKRFLSRGNEYVISN